MQPIQTVQQWNARLTVCNCTCLMPICAAPIHRVQSKEGSASTSETLYTAAVLQHQKDYSTWLAAGGVAQGPPPPQPRECLNSAGEVTTSDSPLGYDCLWGGFSSYITPSGQPDDYIPTIYQYRTHRGIIEGTGWVDRLTVISRGRFRHTNWSSHTYPDGSINKSSGRVDPDNPIPDFRPCTTSDSFFPGGGRARYNLFDDANGIPYTTTAIDVRGATTHELGNEYNAANGGRITKPSCPNLAGLPNRTWFLKETVARLKQLSQPVTPASLTSKAMAKADDADWYKTGNSDSSSLLLTWPRIQNYIFNQINLLGIASVLKTRNRFQIPYSHSGSKYWVWYDVIDEPTGWDATINDPNFIPIPGQPIPQIPKPGRPLRTFYSQNNTVVWTRPGTPIPDPVYPQTPEGDDDFSQPPTNQSAIDTARDTWHTPWFEIPVPTVPGRRRIVNVRYACYSGARYGRLPQTMGQGVELPDP